MRWWVPIVVASSVVIAGMALIMAGVMAWLWLNQPPPPKPMQPHVISAPPPFPQGPRTLTGQLRVNGQPVAGVNVTFEHPRLGITSPPSLMTLTNAAGEFQFTQLALRDGMVETSLNYPHVGSTQHPVQCHLWHPVSATATQVVLEVDPFTTLSGRISSQATGQYPTAGQLPSNMAFPTHVILQRVSQPRSAPGYDYQVRIHVDPQGRFSYSELPEGQYVASAPSRMPSRGDPGLDPAFPNQAFTAMVGQPVTLQFQTP